MPARVHVVYAHPHARGLTREVLDAFLDGLRDAGSTFTISDLYAMGFRSELSRDEYERESGYRADAPVADDVAAEHEKLAAADVWAFVYPVWWADCPARLKGWFDRVWTAGFAHSPMGLRPARKALVLCTAGYDVDELKASGCHQAMRTTMLTDRIGRRALSHEFAVFGGAVRRTGDPGGWEALKAGHLDRSRALARSV